MRILSNEMETAYRRPESIPKRELSSEADKRTSNRTPLIVLFQLISLLIEPDENFIITVQIKGLAERPRNALVWFDWLKSTGVSNGTSKGITRVSASIEVSPKPVDSIKASKSLPKPI